MELAKLEARPKIIIVLDRLRSAHNTGNIFRIAEAIKAEEIITCGYTPTPPHPKLEKTAMGTDKMVKFRHFESSFSAVEALRKEGVKMILAVEPLKESVYAWKMDYKYPAAFIFGNEALGISEETLKICDGAVSLPMFGEKASINVGNCVAALLYIVVSKHFI